MFCVRRPRWRGRWRPGRGRWRSGRGRCRMPGPWRLCSTLGMRRSTADWIPGMALQADRIRLGWQLLTPRLLSARRATPILVDPRPSLILSTSHLCADIANQLGACAELSAAVQLPMEAAAHFKSHGRARVRDELRIRWCWAGVEALRLCQLRHSVLSRQFHSQVASKAYLKIGGSFVLCNTQIQSQVPSNYSFENWRELGALEHANPKPTCLEKHN